mgnify:FL=1
MNILHITDIANSKGNGVAVAVNDYLKYENVENNVAVYNLDSPIGNEKIQKFSFSEYKKLSSLPEPFNKPDIVVFNEVYKIKYLKIARECKKNNIKYVIIPHGCLTNFSRKMKRSRLKKFIALNFVLKNFIKNASAIQYLNEYEKKETKICNNKSIISGNGIDVSLCKDNRFVNKNLIYIGRYNIYHKGLDIIIEVCKKYRKWFLECNVAIELYGRDSNNNQMLLKELIEKNKLTNIVKLKGPIYGDEKVKLLCEAYAFIQTSRFEGQPMGILEALGNGLPCILTGGTSFAEYVNNNQCGFGSNFDVDEIFENIKNMYENEELRNKMSVNAKQSIRRDFLWEDVIKNCVNQYKKIQNEK